jgi:hypothetical protein
MLGRLRNLVSGPWSGIITTNYDTLIEYGLGQYTRGNYLQTTANDDDFGAILCTEAGKQRFFVKLHGSVRGARYVLGTEEYDRTYLSDPRVVAFLTAAMLRYHLVFIGCSLEDEILRLRRRLCLAFGGHIPQAYALLPREPDNVARRDWLVDQAKIVPLLYSVTEGGSRDGMHFEVDGFLEEVRAGVDPAREADVQPAQARVSVELRQHPVGDRLEKIGSTNRDLLELVLASNKEGGITHTNLLSPESIEEVRCPPSLLNLSPNERIYRALFLSSVSLLESSASPTGEPRYCLSPGVANELIARRQQYKDKDN